MRYFVYYTSKNEIPLIVILALLLISGPGKQYFAKYCDISLGLGLGLGLWLGLGLGLEG